MTAIAPRRAPRIAPRAAPRAGSRRSLALGLLGLALLVAVALSLLIGSAPSDLAALWHAIAAPTGTDLDVTIREIRAPRTLLGVVVGACLGVAGALVQGHTRNPIADPGLLGIYQGAALAIVVATSAFGVTAAPALAVASLAGALAASVVVYAIATRSTRGPTPVSLVLAGAAVTALCSGLITAIVLIDLDALDTLRYWQIGSLATRNDALDEAWPLVVIGLALAAANIGSLNALALGDETARGLGVSLLRARSIGVAAVTVLAGSAVLLAGPIAFAGLIVPHLARALVGSDYRWLIPVTMLGGATLLLLADTAGRVVARPGELSASVILAVIGAPLFIALARRRRLSSP